MRFKSTTIGGKRAIALVKRAIVGALETCGRSFEVVPSEDGIFAEAGAANAEAAR